MERFKPIPHWYVTDVLPAFYDFQSLTAIEQTGRLYKTIESLIKDYNSYVDEINKCVNEFMTNTNESQECFKNKLIKIMHDYIAKIDEKIKVQDSVINDAVNYMKNNLSGSLQTLLNEMRDSGQLSADIITAFEDFTNKLNEIDTKVSGYDESIANMETTVNELETSVNNFQASVNEDVTNLETSVNNFQTSVNSKITELETKTNDLENRPVITKVSEIENDTGFITGDYVNNSLTPVNESINNINTEIEGINTELDSVNSELETINSELNNIPVVENTNSESINNVYSCNYINKKFNGVVLYENLEGNNGDVSLNETSANFNYIEIFGYRTLGDYKTPFSEKIYNPNEKRIGLKSFIYHTDAVPLSICVFTATINETTITKLNASSYNVGSDGSVSVTSTNVSGMYITKVIGYK